MRELAMSMQRAPANLRVQHGPGDWPLTPFLRRFA